MKRVSKYDKWLKLLPWENKEATTCPNCSALSIDYLFIGDQAKRIGFCLIWCNECLKGINISRTNIPKGVKAISFAEAEEGGNSQIPSIQYINR
jgi:hypothetical protein